MRRWYQGEGKITFYDDDPNSGVYFMPSFHTEYHWTGTVARTLVNFHDRKWQFAWTTLIALVGIYLAYRHPNGKPHRAIASRRIRA